MVTGLRGMVNRFERQWERDLESHGWSPAQGRPKELQEWVKRHNKDRGTSYRVVEVEGIPSVAWNSQMFNPNAGTGRDYQFLMEFSEGKPKSRVVGVVSDQFRLPSRALAEAIVDYWSLETGTLIDRGNELLGVSDSFLPDLGAADEFLQNLKGLVTIETAKARLQFTETEILTRFQDQPPKRLVGNNVILDLGMKNIEVVISNLLARYGHAVEIVHLAEEIGLTELGLDPGDVNAMANRVCEAVRELHPEFEIVLQYDGLLNIGNEKQVIEAHLRLRKSVLEGWEHRRHILEGSLDDVAARVDDLENECEEERGKISFDEEELGKRAVQSAFLTRFASRLKSAIGE